MVSPNSVPAGLITLDIANQASHTQYVLAFWDSYGNALSRLVAVAKGGTAQLTLKAPPGWDHVGVATKSGGMPAPWVVPGLLRVVAARQAGDSTLLQP